MCWTKQNERFEPTDLVPEDTCDSCGEPTERFHALATDYGTEHLCDGCMAEAMAPETIPAEITPANDFANHYPARLAA